MTLHLIQLLILQLKIGIDKHLSTLNKKKDNNNYTIEHTIGRDILSILPLLLQEKKYNNINHSIL